MTHEKGLQIDKVLAMTLPQIRFMCESYGRIREKLEDRLPWLKEANTKSKDAPASDAAQQLAMLQHLAKSQGVQIPT